VSTGFPHVLGPISAFPQLVDVTSRPDKTGGAHTRPSQSRFPRFRTSRSSRRGRRITRVPFISVSHPALRARVLEKLESLRHIPALRAPAQGFMCAAAKTDGSIEEIDQRLGRTDGLQLYFTAPLRDVGKIVLHGRARVLPRDYGPVWAGECRLDALEMSCFGVGHSRAGVVFARQSGLPAEVIAAIAHHADRCRAKSTG
jgi:hypothetical protein